MRRKGIALISSCLLLCLILASCQYTPSYDVFDTDSEGIIQISTNRPYTTPLTDKNEPQLIDFVIADHRRIKPCESFVADETTVYNVPYNCIESYIDRDRNKVLNRLVYVSVTDAEGNPCEAPAIMDDIFQQLAQLEHDLFTIKIYSIEDEWFVYVELNVNLWDPCSIYYFNTAEKKLIQLYEFDNREVLSVHIISRDRLHSLR